MEEKKNIGITTVIYNSSPHLSLFVDSLILNAKMIGEVVFVDNNSIDDFVSILAGLDGYIKYSIVSNNENKGYAMAVNQGIKKLLHANYEYILVTNNDLRMKEGVLSVMLEDMLDSKTEVVGVPTTSNGREFLIGNRYDAIRKSIIPVPAVHEKEIEAMIARTHTTETHYVQGGIILFKKTFFTTVGLYDDYLFFGGDESDFAIRLIRASSPVQASISLRSYNLLDHFTHHDGRFKLLKARMIMRGETYVLMKHGYGIFTSFFWKKVRSLCGELGKRNIIRYVILSSFLVYSLIVNTFYLRTLREKGNMV